MGAVGREPLLVCQKLLPGDVAGVMIVDHNTPLLAREQLDLRVDRAVWIDLAPRAATPEHVCAGVGRIA